MPPSKELVLFITNELAEVCKAGDNAKMWSTSNCGCGRDDRVKLEVLKKYHHSLMCIADMVGINTYAYKRTW